MLLSMNCNLHFPLYMFTCCALHVALYTLYFTHCTLHFKCCVLHVAPYMFHFTHCTLQLARCTSLLFILPFTNDALHAWLYTLHFTPWGTIRNHGGPYGTIQDRTGTYRTIRDHKESYIHPLSYILLYDIYCIS